jgi:hypothetical protein
MPIIDDLSYEECVLVLLYVFTLLIASLLVVFALRS